MEIGMTLPGMEPGLDRQRIMEWCSRIEAGPFASLAFGERMAFYNPELISMLGACAVLTERVRLSTTVIVMPLHNPVLLAKQLATIDVLSEGRLSVGLGIGGREEDHRAVSANPARIRKSTTRSKYGKLLTLTKILRLKRKPILFCAKSATRISFAACPSAMRF